MAELSFVDGGSEVQANFTVVDDEPSIQYTLPRLISSVTHGNIKGEELKFFTDGSGVADQIVNTPGDHIIFLDQYMPNVNGVDVIRDLHAKGVFDEDKLAQRSIQIIWTSHQVRAGGDLPAELQALIKEGILPKGIVEVMPKPFLAKEFRESLFSVAGKVVEKALERKGKDDEREAEVTITKPNDKLRTALLQAIAVKNGS